jgi:ABC-type lipoprotein release transport system permease subunit
MLGPRDSGGPWYTVIGVVADMRRQGLEREAIPQIFVSFVQNPPSRNVDLFIRTASDHPLAVAGAIRTAVHRVERSAAIDGVSSLEEQLGSYLTQRRFQTSLLIGFSLVALLMAAVGIYGLIQYSITTRTQEIALRLAIGARPGDIFRMMIGEGLTLSLAGAAIGLVGSWWLGRTGSTLLFGVTATDPLTFAAVSLLLTMVATAACYFPARRAMTVDPNVALRAT